MHMRWKNERLKPGSKYIDYVEQIDFVKLADLVVALLLLAQLISFDARLEPNQSNMYIM